MEFLPFEIDVLPEKIITKAEVELGENNETRKISIKEMRKRIKEISNFKCPTDDPFLLQFLRATKFNVKPAMASLHNYFHNKTKYNDIFGERDYECMFKICRDQIIRILPYRDSDGSILVLCHVSRWKVKELPFLDLLHASICIILGCVDVHPATQICGVKIILDVKGLTFEQFLQVKPRYIRIIATAMSSGMPLRLKAYHVFNESFIVKYGWNIAKLVLSEKIKKRVYFHSSSMDSLHSFLNPKILPEELGGTVVYDDSMLHKLLHRRKHRYYEMLKYGYE